MAAPTRPAPAVAPDEGLDRELLLVAATVVVGAVMTILDTTVVNVAIRKLSQEFDSPLATIQWVATGSTLALATVIPLTTRVLPRDVPQPGHRLDWAGLALLSPGLALLIYGLAETSSEGGFASAKVLVPMASQVKGAATPTAQADAYGSTFIWAFVLVAVAFVVALVLLPKDKPAAPTDPGTAAHMMA